MDHYKNSCLILQRRHLDNVPDEPNHVEEYSKQ